MPGKIVELCLAALVGIVLTGAAAWMVFGQDKVTREEMLDYVQHQAPWIMERGTIGEHIKTNSQNIHRLEVIADKMVTSQQSLIVEQRVLLTKFEQLMKR